MAYAKKLLFVCSRNRKRSLTAETIYKGFPGYDVRSAGTQPEARVRVTEGLIGWADLIFVMEKAHRRKLEDKFGDALEGKTVVVLHIPDEFEYMDSTLIDELIGKLSPHVDVPEV